MTEAELETYRLKMKIEVLLLLLRGLYTGLANISPIAVQAQREKFAELRREHAKVALQNLPAGYSDMLAGEYQEILNDSLSFIEEGFRG